MKILIIVPPFNMIKEGYGSKSKIKEGNLPPLGVCYIAGVLEKKNYKVKILDCGPEKLTIKDVLNTIQEFKPKIIGFSITNAHYESMKSLINNIKKIKDQIIIVGGPQATCFPKKILKENQKIDIIVIGEGEKTIIEILEVIEKKSNYSKIKGIAFKNGNQIIITPKQNPITNLDEIPTPSLHLLNLKKYIPLPDQYRKLPATSMLTSRGCTWKKCTFCFEASINAHPYRRHSPERVIKEIKDLQKNYNIKEIDFFDDEFFINEKWIEKFCELIKKEKIKLSWSAYGRVDHISKKMFQLAKEAGCWGIFIGFETGNEDLLKIINKGITLEQSRQACKWAHETGIEIRGSFMLGLPGETPEKALKTINFAKELKLKSVSFTLTHPEPGTKLYDIALKEGKIIKDWVKRTSASYIPKGYKNGKELEKMQKLAFRKFYFRPSYILNTVISIKSIKELKRIIKGFKFLTGVIR